MEENAIQNSPTQASLPTSPVAQNPLPLPRKKNYFLWIITGIFLLLLVGTSTYLLGVNSAKPRITDHVSPPMTQISPSISLPTIDPTDPTANWKTYTNTTYSFTVQYPANLILTDGKTDQGNFENSNSVVIEGKGPGVEFPNYYIAIMPDTASTTRDSSIYDSVSGTDIAKVFSLSVGQSLDMQTTQDFGGGWKFATTYKRLPDIVINGQNFLVIENPKGYGGADRKLFIKKNGYVYMIGSTYQTTPPVRQTLADFQQFYSTFKFTDQTQSSTGYGSNELNGFPIYPGSTFVKKDQGNPCVSSQTPDTTFCDETSYQWSSSDGFSQISGYYSSKKNIANTGWSCNGGSGGNDTTNNTGAGSVICTKGDLYYYLEFNVSGVLASSITLTLYKNGEQNPYYHE